MKNGWRWITVLVSLAFIGVIIWSMYVDGGPPEKLEAKITVIACGGAIDRWRAMEQGIQQACGDLGIERPVVTLVQRDGAAQLDGLLQRDLENGLQGLLLISADKEASAMAEQVTGRIPVVLLESTAEESQRFIGADDGEMGRLLADYCLQAALEQPLHIAVLAHDLERWSVSQRYDAFMSHMERMDAPVTVLTYNPAHGDLKSYLASRMATHQPHIDLLAVLDNDSLEIAVDATPAAMTEVRLCGIGSSEKAVHALDIGAVDALVYQNEYAIGYTGTMALADELNLARRPPAADTQYLLVTKDMMYETEWERLLFPIGQ